MKKLLTLIKIEGKISLRGIDGIFFGVIMPIGIALLIGFISGAKPAYAGATHTKIEEAFGALITVGICATAFMGLPLGIANYRDKKILKHYFVTPASPSILLFTYVIINIITSLLSMTCIYLTMRIVFNYNMKGAFLPFILAYFLVLFAMYGLGMLIASLCTTIKSVNIVTTIVYFPMLFLSGATVPYEVFPKALQKVADFMPLTQGIKLLKGITLATPPSNLMFQIILMAVFAIAGAILSIKFFRWE